MVGSGGVREMEGRKLGQVFKWKKCILFYFWFISTKNTNQVPPSVSFFPFPTYPQRPIHPTERVRPPTGSQQSLAHSVKGGPSHPLLPSALQRHAII